MFFDCLILYSLLNSLLGDVLNVTVLVNLGDILNLVLDGIVVSEFFFNRYVFHLLDCLVLNITFLVWNVFDSRFSFYRFTSLYKLRGNWPLTLV